MSRSPDEPRSWGSLALVGGATVLWLEGVRATVPLAVGGGAGVLVRGTIVGAAAGGAGIYLATFLRRRGRAGRTPVLLVAAAGLACVRLATQLVGPFLEAVVATIVLATVLLVAELTAAHRVGVTGTLFTGGLLVGLAVDTALMTSFQTWDPSWQDGSLPWAIAVATATAPLAVVGWRRWGHSTSEASRQRGGDLAVVPGLALGAFLALHVLLLHNVGFVASGSGWSLALAGALVLMGDGVALATLLLRSLPSASLAGLILIPIGASMAVAGGPVLGLLAVAGQILAALAVRTALLERTDVQARPRPALTAAVAVVLGTMGLVLGLSLVPRAVALPFGSVLPAVAGGMVLWFAALRGSPHPATVGRTVSPIVACVPVLLLVVPLIVAAASPDPERHELGSSVRLVSYNVRSAIDVRGRMHPEALAEIIDGQHPELAALQEVGRGWLPAGSLDLSAWLARRLNMHAAWAPDGDGRRGVTLLGRSPAADHIAFDLPRGEAPLARGALLARLLLQDGRTMTIVVLHLEHGADQTATRLAQIDRALDEWGGAPLTVLAADLNASPGSAEIERLLAAGFVPVPDLTGDPSLATFPSDRPVTRIDWILGTPDLRFSGFEVLPGAVSDHLPLVVTIEP